MRWYIPELTTNIQTDTYLSQMRCEGRRIRLWENIGEHVRMSDARIWLHRKQQAELKILHIQTKCKTCAPTFKTHK